MRGKPPPFSKRRWELTPLEVAVDGRVESSIAG
jgi:hypothetical protein